MISIGLTGSIAAGKSEVARLLAEHGAVVIDADREAHATYAPGTPGFEAVVQAFGDSVVAPDGSIDRRALGGIVFSQPQRLQQLNAIVWPLIAQRLAERQAQEIEAGTGVFVVEAALLYEGGWDALMDEVWFVYVSPAVAKQRLMASRALTAADAEARIAARGDLQALRAKADVVIENEGDIESLARRVDAEWTSMLARHAEA